MSNQTLVAECRSCLFWMKLDRGAKKVGLCRRYAPRPADEEYVEAQWPVTKVYYWCGEYEQDPDAPPPPPPVPLLQPVQPPVRGVIW